MAEERRLGGDSADGIEGLAGQAKAAGSAAMEQAQELAPKARETAYSAAESGREGAADAIERAATQIEGRVGGVEGMPAKAAGRAAQGMHVAAEYLEHHETAEIIDDVEQYVRTHPMRSLTAAVATGFIVGRVLR
ncbi:MAG: hypothetical protein EPO16_00640 [Dehalococcoidia bacterium]|nr:MAG: hypothetical protein EPO16_00640 [Dehalococcoidia bacterium]